MKWICKLHKNIFLKKTSIESFERVWMFCMNIKIIWCFLKIWDKIDIFEFARPKTDIKKNFTPETIPIFLMYTIRRNKNSSSDFPLSKIGK